MSIQITTLKGTNSISSDRITINDNFNILKDSINDVLSYIDLNVNRLTIDNIEVKNLFVTEETILVGLKTDEIKFNNTNKLSVTTIETFNFLETNTFDGISIPGKTTSEITDIYNDLIDFNVDPELRPNVIVFDKELGKFKGFDGTQFVDLN